MIQYLYILWNDHHNKPVNIFRASPFWTSQIFYFWLVLSIHNCYLKYFMMAFQLLSCHICHAYYCWLLLTDFFHSSRNFLGSLYDKWLSVENRTFWVLWDSVFYLTLWFFKLVFLTSFQKGKKGGYYLLISR